MELHFLKTVWSDIIILKNGDEFAMIDTGFEEQFPEIKKYLDAMGVKRLSFIVLTHFHRDHYGSICKIIKNYDVDTVYFKNYSGLDKTTATGVPADEEYREKEKETCHKIRESIKKYSSLIDVESLSNIKFGNYTLELFNNNNSMKELFEDENSSSYHEYLYNENQNSMALFLDVDGVTVFLGGDIMDRESPYRQANYVNYQIAAKIGREIDIYKVPHHGTVNSNSEGALNIYRPKLAIITNGIEYLKTMSTICDDLRRANKDVEIVLTEKHNVVVKISRLGKIEYEMS